MYERHRLVLGAGLLCSMWLAVFVLIASTGVALTAPLSGTGGFTIQADYVSASAAVTTPARAESTRIDETPAARFEVTESSLRNVRVTKTLSVDELPGLNGRIRLVLRNPDWLDLDGVAFKTDELTADTAVWRGFVLDERRADSALDQFVASAGPTPNDTPNTDDPLAVQGSGDEPAFELYDARIEAFSLTVDSMDFSDVSLLVQYDPDSDGTYEYGV